ncbi:unnamed protein product [Medioppia subpectinata]|uniref:Tyrosinase copper-binding domain-containing protein n=1 Tax=Medioppia subpectinata TaxID=1979941 RepID=A0A7R9KZT3_9ACAR|nr:unnamed protein product [Medioppia subpectinata]CAG2112701.1 unnamed protein product [Medioppia subpectinata]
MFLIINVRIDAKEETKHRTYVRKSADALTFKEWQDIRRGFQVMKDRKQLNPLSLLYQANIHGYPEYDGSPAQNAIATKYNWQQCNHHQYFFLIWHRMYLYFFERILRKASGSPDLTIPYWDYADPMQRQLPEPYRWPANETENPLYIEQRCKNVNDGKPLSAEITDPFPSLKSRFFTAKLSDPLAVCSSLAGGRVQYPVFVGRLEGILERFPHDRIHISTGGPGGYMGNLCWAARDPIFWPHHAMIDRVWESWLHNGGKPYTERGYLNTSFKFYDETGVLGTYYIRDFINASRLHYKYDKLLELPERIPETNANSPKLYISVNETNDLAITNEKRSIILNIKPKYQKVYMDMAQGRIDNLQIRVTLQISISVTQTGLMYEMYLNLPPNTQPYEGLPNFIGYLSNFGGVCVNRTTRDTALRTNCFEMTDNLIKVLRNEYNYYGDVKNYLTITIVPKSCDTVVYPLDEDYIIKEIKYRPFVRKSLNTLTFSEWEDLRRGFRVMEARKLLDPTSLTYQANIHGYPEYDGSPASNVVAAKYNWQQCNHAEYFFTVWHRMYLYFFERILRRASGNPNFALPYWDYADPMQRQLPEPYRMPPNMTENPLYIEKRCQSVNEGKPLSAAITDPYPALRSRFFTAKLSDPLAVCSSFGGGRVRNPVFASNREGLLENLPHDHIHDSTGGPGGYMADLCLAARDPIFWSHHCMIDRIWESWLNNGGEPVNEPRYLNTSFKFYDETGVLGTYYVKDFLNVTKLGYKYDKLLELGEEITQTNDNNPKLYFSVDETNDLQISNEKRSIILNIKPKYRSFYKSIAQGKYNNLQVRFTLQAEVAASITGLMYDMYLNLPPNTRPYEGLPNFIGYLSQFTAHCVNRTARQTVNVNTCFEITDNLITVLQNEYNYYGDVKNYLNLTIVPKSCDTVVYPLDEDYIIRFSRALVVHYFPYQNQKRDDYLDPEKNLD